MAKPHTKYVCQNCHAAAIKWTGKCESCGAWNTLVEEVSTGGYTTGGGRGGVRDLTMTRLSDRTETVERWSVGIAEFDRVLGGGLVPGTVVLLTGEPGIGKSTLLLQVAAALTAREREVIYVSGEESEEQIRLRAARLGVGQCPVMLAPDTDAAAIAKQIMRSPPNTVMIIDSIQTLHLPSIDSAPNSPSQIRGSAHEISQAAKSQGIPVILVGHVVKDGSVAGPKTLEHMVDAVLAFEGDQGLNHRILRTTKNRYGATDEIGVFEMTATGLAEVPNPSSLFLSDARAGTPGCAVFPTIEGSRPLLVEIQALVCPMGYGSPRRSVVGWDTARMSMILAVLETRCGIKVSEHDVYLNIVGGMRISEPAADLAVAAAIASACLNIALPDLAVYFGEVGLSGEVRPVSQPDNRLKEARKLGFNSASCAGPHRAPPDLNVTSVRRLRELIAAILALDPNARRPEMLTENTQKRGGAPGAPPNRRRAPVDPDA